MTLWWLRCPPAPHPLLLVPAVRRNEVAILWRVRWCGRDEMVNTLLQYSQPPLSPSNFLPPTFFPSLVRSVDYEDTSSFLTVWPLLHVLMRSAYLHCIINKSEKLLFPSLSFTCSFISPSSAPVILRSRWKTGNGVLLDFLCAPPLPLFLLHVCDHRPPVPFYVIWKERNYFCTIMWDIKSSFYDTICFNYDLNVIDVRDFVN